MDPRTFRTERRLSLQDVADKMSASLGRPLFRSDVFRWERRCRIPDEHLSAYLDALGAAGAEREELARAFVGPQVLSELGLAERPAGEPERATEAA